MDISDCITAVLLETVSPYTQCKQSVGELTKTCEPQTSRMQIERKHWNSPVQISANAGCTYAPRMKRKRLMSDLVKVEKSTMVSP